MSISNQPTSALPALSPESIFQPQPIIRPNCNSYLAQLKQLIHKISGQLQDLNQLLRHPQSNTYEKNKLLEEKRRLLKKELLDVEYDYQKAITLQKEQEYRELSKIERQNVQDLKREIELEFAIEQQKLLDEKERQFLEMGILRERQRIQNGIMKEKIYRPDSFTYDVARLHANENALLEQEIVGICQFYKRNSLGNCPIYGYKRYQPAYGYCAYNGAVKYGGK